MRCTNVVKRRSWDLEDALIKTLSHFITYVMRSKNTEFYEEPAQKFGNIYSVYAKCYQNKSVF